MSFSHNGTQLEIGNRRKTGKLRFMEIKQHTPIYLMVKEDITNEMRNDFEMK